LTPTPPAQRAPLSRLQLQHHLGPYVLLEARTPARLRLLPAAAGRPCPRRAAAAAALLLWVWVVYEEGLKEGGALAALLHHLDVRRHAARLAAGWGGVGARGWVRQGVG
jgi:hypothetical protein